MTHDKASRTLPTEDENATRSPPRTLLDVKKALQKVPLAPAERSDLVSALNAVAQLEVREGDPNIDAALARVSVDARSLAPRLDRRVGARLGYERPSWRNIGWRVRKALKAAGAWELFANRKLEISPAWQEVVGLCPPHSYIRLLGYWATIHDVPPDALDDGHANCFLEWLLTWKPKQYARECYLDALRTFNGAVRSGPLSSRPPITVVTRYTAHYSVQKSWRPEVVAEADRVILKLREPDIDDDECFEPVSERTAKHYRQRLFRTLSAYIAARNLDPSSVKSLTDLLAPDAAKAALDFMLLWTRRHKPDATRTSDIYSSAKLIATVADRCYRNILPAETILTLQRMARKRSPVRNGMTAKNRALLKLFDDEEFLARLLHLPFRVFERILKRNELRRVDAVKLMLAVAVGQSCEAPMRPANQAGLIVHEHIFKIRQDQHEALAIRIPAVEVKNTVDLDFELSGEFLDVYDTYLRRGRPLLCEAKNRFLYPGRGLGPKSQGSLSTQIARFIEAELGVRVTGQQFRHVIGYIYLKAHPGEYEVVRQLLGHKDITTTMAFYAAMDMRAASKKVSAFIAQRRKDLTPIATRRRKTSRRKPVPDYP